jgi:hypothetical protein
MSTNKLAASASVREFSEQKNSFPALRTPELLARWPLIGIAMFVFGTLVFAALYANLTLNGPLLQWDRYLSTTLPAIGLKSPAFIETLMNAGFYVGKEVIQVFGVLLCIYFIFKRYWEELTMAVIGWGGAAIIFNLLSTFIGRPRPTSQIWIIVNIPGFPSGHAITVVVF